MVTSETFRSVVFANHLVMKYLKISRGGPPSHNELKVALVVDTDETSGWVQAGLGEVHISRGLAGDQ